MNLSGRNLINKLSVLFVMLFLSSYGLMAQLVNVNSTPETYKLKALLDSPNSEFRC